MKCLQCKKEATETAKFGEYQIRECADGHRTAQLTAEQTKEIETKLGLDLDADNDATEFAPVKKSKRRPAAAKPRGVPCGNMAEFDQVIFGGK